MRGDIATLAVRPRNLSEEAGGLNTQRPSATVLQAIPRQTAAQGETPSNRP